MAAHPITGRYVMAWLNAKGHRGLTGYYGGVVRRVRMSKRGGLLGLTFQLPGGPRMLDGTTASARCRGPTVTLARDELRRAHFVTRGKPGPALVET